MRIIGMRYLICFLSVLFFVSTVNIPASHAQDSPQWHLPDGAIARLGKGTIEEIAYSPDGSRLAVAGGIGIWLYDLTTYREVALLTGHRGGVNSVAFSPDGRTLASGSGDRTARLWDVSTGSLINTLEHTSGVNSVSFSPDGTTLASGSGDETVRLWDVATGSVLNTLEGHTSSVNSVAFSPDGRTLASGSSDKTVRLWDVATGSLLNMLTGHAFRVESVAYSPDGSIMASGSGDGTVLLWQLTPTSTPDPSVVSVDPAEAESPAVGESLTININITGGIGVAGYQVTVNFDPTALRYVSSTNADYLPAGAHVLPPETTHSSVKISAASLAGPTNGDGTLATVTFEVVEVKTSTLRLTDVILSDAAGQPLAVTTADGIVTGQDTPPLRLDVNADGEVTVIDLAIVALFYGTQVPAGINFPADVNADGVVNILDLTLVAQGIDAANSGIQGLSLQEIEAALAAAIEQTADIEVIAEAPVGFGTAQHMPSVAYRNVADALADAEHLGYSVHAVLKELLQLLTEMAEVPETTALLPNYPNPFNPETWIPYHLAKAANVTLTIYDMQGVAVRQLMLGYQPAGVYRSKHRAAYWNGRNDEGEKVSSGIYFYTLTAGDFTATRKLLIIK